jgi:UDP-N-acetyl-D-mannosaminuronic acid transferase (WecB/TagA/CpsF family)
MLSEPQRLAGRYLVNNPRFVAQVVLQELGARHYEL